MKVWINRIYILKAIFWNILYYFFIYEAFQWQIADLATHLIFLLAKRHDYPVSWLMQTANNFETWLWSPGILACLICAWYTHVPLSANQNGREWWQITARASPLNLRMAGSTRKRARSRTVIFLITGAATTATSWYWKNITWFITKDIPGSHFV